MRSWVNVQMGCYHTYPATASMARQLRKRPARHRNGEKDVARSSEHAFMKNEISNPATKISDLQSGHIQKRRVKCGKSNCRCAKGKLHSAYYHIWHADGQRFQRYVRRSQLDRVRAACQAYRELQTQLRAGRAEYKRTLARARELFRMMSW